MVNIAHMGGKNNEAKCPLGRPFSRVVDNIKTTSYVAMSAI
jgi:hypothetical protein